MLDRMVGYEISPLLWAKVKRTFSRSEFSQWHLELSVTEKRK